MRSKRNEASALESPALSELPNTRTAERRLARRQMWVLISWPLVALILIVGSVTIAGCSAPSTDREIVSLPALSFLSAPGAAAQEEAAEQSIARSIWAVMNGRRVLGSAIAVSETTLMAACDVDPADPANVEVVRRSARRPAELVTRDRSGRLCELRPANVRLQVIPGYRPFDTVDIGELVLAAVSRTSRSFDLLHGTITGKGGADDPFLETSLTLPPGTRSAALFDHAGNLMAMGSAGPVGDAVVVAAPIMPEVVPGLAQGQVQPVPAAATQSLQ